MAKKLLQGLAITFGGGLALGAGFKLGQAAGRSRETGGPEFDSLNRRLLAFEHRVQQVESRPPSDGPGPPRSDEFESRLLHQSLDALETRLGERIELMSDHLRKVETRFGSEMQAEAKRQAAQVTALGRRLEDIQAKLRAEIEAGDRRGQDHVASVVQELHAVEARVPAQVDAAVASRMEALNRKLEADLEQAQNRTLEALVDTLETKVVRRISELESSLQGQSEAIGGLREKSLRSDQNMQKLLVAVERLCEQTERQMLQHAGEPEVGPVQVIATEEVEAVPEPAPADPVPEPVEAEPEPQAVPALVEAAAAGNGAASALQPDAEPAPPGNLDNAALDLLGPDPKPKKRWRIPLAFSLFTISGTLGGLQ